MYICVSIVFCIFYFYFHICFILFLHDPVFLTLMNMRLDICFAVNTLSQYIVELRGVHLIAAKNVMRYLNGTIYYGIIYASYHEISLQGFIDSD
jgi:hypothetical protein